LGAVGLGERVAPVTDDVDVGLLVLHHALGEVNLFGQAHSVDLAADASDFAGVLTAVGVLVGEIDGGVGGVLGVFRVSVRDAVGVEVPVALDLCQGEGLGIVVPGVGGTLLEAIVGRGVVVPEAAGAFVAGGFGFDDGAPVAGVVAVGGTEAGGPPPR